MAPRARAPVTWLYYIGLAIDTGLLLMMLSNAVLMPAGTYPEDPTAGLTAFGRVAIWALPAALVALMAVAWALNARGATLAAVVLLWLPAVPFAIAMAVGLGLAVLFILFGNRG